MTYRRFTDKPALDPGAVRSLPMDHPAMVERRTVYPSTVVEVNEDYDGRVLVSGEHNRKLGKIIAKGRFKGFHLYGLTLEERATCPDDCGVRDFCYGNGLGQARRHRVGDLDIFALFLEDEIRTILADPIDGLMVRLHVLGDFPSIEYVAMWGDLLDAHEKLACYGYTHRRTTKWGGDEIGDAIESLKDRFGDRFRIRWSSPVSRPDGAVVINYVPDRPRIDDGLVCPAQTDSTACCASCGLCWDAKNDCIVFIKHGPKSDQAAAESASTPVERKKEPHPLPAPPKPLESIRPVVAVTIAQKRDPVASKPPEVRWVNPTELKVEPAYQRDLSGKSIKLIRKIVLGWDWSRFKPPVCAETSEGLFVIDGQHTAIGAASHPEIKEIPVMVVEAPNLTHRAGAFVAHNRDRLTMTPAQVFYGDVTAGDKSAQAVLEAVIKAGASVPRLPIPRGYAKPGQITAVGKLREIQKGPGIEVLERVLGIAVLSKVAPINNTVLAALTEIVDHKRYARIASRPDVEIAAALASIKNIDSVAQHHAAETGQSRLRAAAQLIADAVHLSEGAAA